MRRGKSVCFPLILLGMFATWAPGAKAQTDQQTSVADAARQAREQKKAAAKQDQVITNDTLEPAKASTSAPATPAPASNSASTEAAAANDTTAATTDSQAVAGEEAKSEDSTKKKEEEARKQLESLKQEIQALKKEVDFDQRALSLANDAYYSRPDFSKDSDGKAKLDQMLSDLGVKKEELQDLLAKLPAGETADEPKPAAQVPQQ